LFTEGIVGRSVGLPDIHSGYGFAIGNMAAFDMDVSLIDFFSLNMMLFAIYVFSKFLFAVLQKKNSTFAQVLGVNSQTSISPMYSSRIL
jgi:hypothetical protein